MHKGSRDAVKGGVVFVHRPMAFSETDMWFDGGIEGSKEDIGRLGTHVAFRLPRYFV